MEVTSITTKQKVGAGTKVPFEGSGKIFPMIDQDSELTSETLGKHELRKPSLWCGLPTRQGSFSHNCTVIFD
jgi:hypothetical protein